MVGACHATDRKSALHVGVRAAGWLSTAALAFALSAPQVAEAQLLRERNGLSVAFEAKAGPYLPDLGRAPTDGGLQSWDAVYGAGRTRVLFVAGFDVQMLRGEAGTLGLGLRAGLIGWDGGISDASQSTGRLNTRFDVVPIDLTLSYRFDYLVDRTVIPLAPYVRGGLAYYVWWNGGPDGPFNFRTAGGEEDASGARPGLTGTVGVSLALNAVDRAAAAQLANALSIQTTYLFFEGQLAWVDGFGDGNIDLSDLTWFGGLMIEL